ncbi:PREDICTED: torsin-1A-like [Branchiostoma belcheri]|uniref:Torsin-1A-like n=1 Tax=Branchiostoma belcheri TaxID=7741 RepID=A0A6P5ABT5_BRABE|nr:PREDICTED: torsin-1A-like [Branchiostoma belcheri]
MATILLPGASLGPGKNFLPAVESAKRTDACPLPSQPAQFDAGQPLRGLTISEIEEKLRVLCHNRNPRLLLGLAELNVQQHQSWVRLAHFLILRANELHQEPGRVRRVLEWPINQARARPVMTSAVTVLVLAVLVIVFITVPDNCGGQFKPNMTRLDETIQRKLHGQPLVQNIVVRYITDHVDKSPERALAMSFHGLQGVGKNYVGGMIADSLFLDGLNSPCVRAFTATKHFPHHDSDNIKGYKDMLHRLIPEAIRSCPRTLFIFDETDKMPEGLIDTIKPYVDVGPVDGQNFNKAMFLFLSNTAAGTITGKFIELRKGGTDRKDFGIKQFENIIKQSAETTDGTDKKTGLWHASLLKHSLVHVVPFLPLELKEVKECIDDVINDLRDYRLTGEMWDRISEEISFLETDGVKYSENGCRDVRSKALLHLGK